MRAYYTELLTTITTDDVVAARVRRQRLGDGLDDFVSDRMSISVVDIFEVVDVDHEASEIGAVLLRRFQDFVELFEQGPTVVATREGIDSCERLQLLVLPLEILYFLLRRCGPGPTLWFP